MSMSKYKPYCDKNELCIETKDDYFFRISKLLPNFPKEVLLQWFYDHFHQIADYEALDYPKLIFEKKSWKTGDVPVNNFGNVNCVISYKYNYFSAGKRNSRLDKIASYFINFGTWPIPPIFLENLVNRYENLFYFTCGYPYHLIEGHNRLALFYGFKEQNKLVGEHVVYVAMKK